MRNAELSRAASARRTTDPARGPSVPARVGSLLPHPSSFIPLLALVAVAEAWVRLAGVPVYLVPPPSAVAARLVGDPGFFLGNGASTLAGALAGLALGCGVALPLGAAMAHSSALERTLLPLAILVKVTPVVALAPLFVIWFGFGWLPTVLVVALFTFFPVLVGTIAGLRTVDPGALAFLGSVAASPAEIFWKLRVPTALPQLFAALRVALPLALIGAVVAEWLGSDRGLGHVVGAAHTRLDLPTLAAAVVVLAAAGALLTAALGWIERRALWWAAVC
jgi:NitT/TauT family transport system permease protein